jgi:hypothetical protein
MNEVNENLKEHLEQATSPKIPDGALDSEAAPLREGWRVLSRALETSNNRFDEAAFAAKLQAELLAQPAASPLPQTTSSRQHWGWVVGGALLGGALAASLVFALVIVNNRLAHQPGQVVKKPPTENDQQNHLAATSGTKEINSLSSTGASQNDSPWSWDDPLDSQISVAAAQMESMQKPAPGVDRSISALDWQLKLMAQDLEEGAL